LHGTGSSTATWADSCSCLWETSTDEPGLHYNSTTVVPLSLNVMIYWKTSTCTESQAVSDFPVSVLFLNKISFSI
jgi:hypothetical protein